MLKSLVVQNYRSCLQTSLDLNPSLSVLIGPNGSGKTNILQAIMLLNKIAYEERHYLRRPDMITASSKVRATFQLGSIDAHLRASIDTHTDESNNDVVRGSSQRWSFKSRNGRRASLDTPLVVAARGTEFVRMYRRRTWLRQRLGQPLIAEPVWAMRALKKVADFCRGIKYYGASQFTNPNSCPVSFEIEVGDGSIRRPIRLSGHARLLYNMYSASKADSAERYEQFIEIVGPRGLRLISELKFREVPTSSIDHSVRVGGKIEVQKRRKLLVVPQFRVGRQRLSPNQLSEGTFKTLALLFHVITSDSTALLIEEPEVCVHHGLLASILELIKSYSGQKQMILSTHSDYVLDHVAPENVFRVTLNRSQGTVAEYIPKTMRSKELQALRRYLEQEGNLGEFWREGGLGDRP